MLSNSGIVLSCLLIGSLSWNTLILQAQDTQPKVAIKPRAFEPSNRAPSANLRLDLKLVLVPVSVTDALDRPVTTLSRDSFRLSEDGVSQPVVSFSQEDGPVSLGLLFDSSGSMKNRIDASVEALRLVFRTAMPGDEFFVVQFADKAQLLGGFTTDPEEIHRRLGFVEARGWTALLDAIAVGSHHMKSARNSRRVLLILSDGGDNNSRFSEAEIRSMVMEGDLRVYGIGLMHRPRILQQLAEETGGKVLIAQNLSELPDVVERLSRDIRSQYMLGYSSSNPRNDGKYHKVKVELTPPPGSPPLHASWRRGYYAPGE
jgi:Ca-activated chloride channel homolog